MVYLDNKKDPQEVWIPRNDGNGSTHSGSNHSYQEGYADGVNDQKAKLASTAFTENGDYQRNDGWSAITVNVPQSGSVLEGKEIVVSQDVTIVVPTSGYDGFSAVTVDATEYGQTNYDSGFDDGYTDGYSSGSSEGYDSGYTEGYNSGYTSGETDGYNSGYTSGETHQKSLLVSTAITQNGSYQRENGYSAITVNVPSSGVYGSKTITVNGTYSASTDNLDGYSAITVNVPTSGESEIIICSSGQCWFDFDYTMVYGDYIDIEHCTFGKIGSHSGSSSHQQLIGGDTGEWFRIGQPSDNSIYFKYFWQNVYENTFSNDPFLNDSHLVFSKDAITIDGNVFTSYTTTQRSLEPNIIVFANTSGGNDKIKNQTAKVGTIRVYGADGTLKATFKPMLDEFNVPFFKYVEEDIDIYALNGTPAYEVLPSSDYQSGYTDGYNSGYTSGYTDGQSAGSGYTINQLASRQYGITDPTINVDVEPYAFCESKASASVLNGHLTIGSGCTSIGIAAFFNSFITSVTFTNENTIRFVGDSNFSLSRIQGELELPQNIELNTASTVNSNGAFGGCHYITSLIAKCGVITPKCFSSCNRLNTLELHNVSSIGGYAFDGCSALTSIKIYDKVPSIDNSRSPFLNVASSGTVHYESGLNVSTWQNNTDISGWTFISDL